MFQYVSCMCLFDVVVTGKYKMLLGGQKSHTHTPEPEKKDKDTQTPYRFL